MRGGLVAVIGGELAQDFIFQFLEIDAALLEERIAFLQVGFGRAVKLPDQTFFPVRPASVARALSVREGDEHEGIEVLDRLDDVGEVRNGRRIVEVARLRGFGEQNVVVDEQDERPALRGR